MATRREYNFNLLTLLFWVITIMYLPVSIMNLFIHNDILTVFCFIGLTAQILTIIISRFISIKTTVFVD